MEELMDFSLTQEMRETIAYTLSILFIITCTAPWWLGLIAKPSLKSKLRRMCFKKGLTPEEARAELRKGRAPWQVRYLTWKQRGRVNEYEIKKFLKSFTPGVVSYTQKADPDGSTLEPAE